MASTLRFSHVAVAASVLALAAPWAAAQGQQGSPLMNELLNCRSLLSDSERLACMDRASGALAEAVEAGQVAIVEREQAVAAERDSFGLSFANPARVFSAFLGQSRPSTEEGLEQYEDGVVATRRPDGEIEALQNLPVRSISEDFHGRVIVTLHNGQVWRQIDNRRLRAPRSVDGVTLDVQRGALGSFFMSLSTSSVQVRAQRD